MNMKLRATFIDNKNPKIIRQTIEFPVNKIKTGKFDYATQKNLEQVLEALDASTHVILEVGEDAPSIVDASYTELIERLRTERMILAAQWIRATYNSSLRPTVAILREYFNWPNPIHKTVREVGITKIINDIKSGVLAQKLSGLEKAENMKHSPIF
jgi:hypothetical protein